jgi:hypothetical protein
VSGGDDRRILGGAAAFLLRCDRCSQLRGDGVRSHAVDFQHFSAASAAGDDAHAAFRDTQLMGNELDQRTIGGVIDWRGGDADFDGAAVQSRQLRLGGARLDVDVEAGGWH